jgi:hypothetical protein
MGLVVLLIVALSRSREAILDLDLGPAYDIDLSPDGEWLLISGIYKGEGVRLGGSLYKVADGTLQNEFADGASNAAWSYQGDQFVISCPARSNLQCFSGDGFHTVVELEGAYPSADAGLSYDNLGNLFVCNGTVVDMLLELPAYVWPQREDGLSPHPLAIPSTRNGRVLSVSGAAMSDQSERIAIANGKAVDIVEASITLTKNTVAVQRSRTVTPQDFGPSWVQITPDGRYVLALSPSGMICIDVTAESPRVLFHVDGTPAGQVLAVRQPLAVSFDGRRVAFAMKDQVEVRTIPHGELVRVIGGSFVAVSLSRDGHRLAVLAQRAPRARVYNLEK